MRMFFSMVGILAWVAALSVLWIFSESGGALTAIAAGVFAVVAMVALVGERVLKTLEEIRDGEIIVRPERRATINARPVPAAAQPGASLPL